MKDDILKWVKTCVIVVVGILAVDLAFGKIMSYYSEKQGLPGDYTKIEYLFRESQEDVVIVGASVAINSIMPDLMCDSLGLSIFNGGCNAQNLIFFRCLIDGMLKQHTPQGVILVLQPEDFSYDDAARIQLLNPYYGKSAVIDSALVSQNHKEALFLKSSLYRYNTVWFRIFLQSLLPNEEMQNSGFVAKRKPNYLPTLLDEGDEPDSQYISELKRCYLEEIFAQLKSADVEVVVLFAPYYKIYPNHGNPVYKRAIVDVCRKWDVEVIDDNQMDYFLERPELFYDNVHLNGDGAKVFTQMFLKQIKESEFYSRIKAKEDERANNGE